MANWFIALPVPASAWFETLAAPPRTTRRFHPDDLHVTVAFLGEVGADRAAHAFDALRDHVIPPRDVSLGRVVPMGAPRRWSALAAEVADATPEDPPLADLLTAPRNRALAAAGAPAETRSMRPHVTIARVRRRKGGETRREALAWAETLEIDARPLELARLALFTRADATSDRTYRIVDERPLQDPA